MSHPRGVACWLFCLGLTATVIQARAGGWAECTPLPEPPVADLAQQAIALCHLADTVVPAERRALLSRARTLAERAMREPPETAAKHFAVFCTLGKEVADAGLGLRTLWALPRLRVAADRAAALAPDWADALAGRGALLLRLPAVLGGDVREGERLLRMALALDPYNASARLVFADGLLAAGRVAEAHVEAERALLLLRAAGRDVEAARAAALLAAH